MCILTSNLCYCFHRSPPKWAFCSNATEPKCCSPTTDDKNGPSERCSGRADFCCSPACCRFEENSAKEAYVQALRLVERQRKLGGLGEGECKGRLQEAVEGLEREAKVHGECAGKRGRFVEGLRGEQGCLFEVDGVEE